MIKLYRRNFLNFSIFSIVAASIMYLLWLLHVLHFTGIGESRGKLTIFAIKVPEKDFPAARSSQIPEASSLNSYGKDSPYSSLDLSVKIEKLIPIGSPVVTLPHPLRLFPEPLKYVSDGEDQDNVLVVGGTDGSGTRRVVQILTQLGVLMVSEDPETYDIHADLVGGWPEIVKPVIRETRSLMYDPSKLHDALKHSMASSLKRLLDQVERDSLKPTSYRLAVGGALPRPRTATASKVKHGFKAPVAMTLSPWWAHILPRFKLLHVLRDGRDIAFSVNQGPVDKFYKDMYGAQEGGLPQVKGIRLWSDWNDQLHEWARVHARSTGKETSFQYQVVHSEDLVSPSVAVRFAAIYHLARFVGSSLSEEDLCCLAVQDVEFLGSHDRSQVKKKDAEKNLASRFGKWRSKLEKDRKLKDSMYAAGLKGLQTFGYEPLRALATEDMTTESGFRCALSEDFCNGKVEENKHVEELLQLEEWGGNGACKMYADLDYKGEDISAFEMPAGDKSSCCRYVSHPTNALSKFRRCKETDGCKFFTVDPNAGVYGMCYLKSGNSGAKQRSHLISGNAVS